MTARFRRSLVAALECAVDRLFDLIGNEKLYGVSLCTSGENDFSYLVISANTEEKLHAAAEKYACKHPEYAGESGRKLLRWMTGDWGYHNFGQEVEKVELPAGRGARRDQTVYRTLVECVRQMRASPKMTARAPDAVFLITCGDMSDDFFLKGLKRLNPTSVVEAYLEEHTPQAFFRELMQRPIAEQKKIVFALHRDLALGIQSPSASQAAARNVDRYILEGFLREFGDDGIAHLLDLVERYGFGPIFNEEGSAACRRFGAFTAENSLCTSAIFALCAWEKISPRFIRRMQDILRKRVEADRELAITTTLAENIARMLHQLAPESFPRSELDPKTNHLRNPEPFLPK
ncbi:MAG: DUF4303 domain-containing protein [Opitutaceae bacterium]|nr:DUF4303 domain-containing protein [Opitutaceae bacterium]